MCQHNSYCGCGCQGQQTACTANCCTKIKTTNVQYSGPNLSCLNINLNDDLTTIIQILSSALCANTTTSTSSTSSSSTTTTTTTVAFYLWEAKLTQVDNRPPEVSVIHSTFGETGIISIIGSAGNYQIIFTGQIPQLNTNTTLITNSGVAQGSIEVGVANPNSIFVRTTLDDQALINNMLLDATVIVKHYNNIPPQATTAYAFDLSFGFNSHFNACNSILAYNTTVYANTPNLAASVVLYTDSNLTVPFNGGGQFFIVINGDNAAFDVTNLGVITSYSAC